VDISKQSSAFPPNFIHSLDASHMFLTALACYTKANLTSFAAVHDSFYSHACDYETLQRVLKEEFISLYSQPILENLRQELIERYRGYRVPIHPLASLKRSSQSSSFFTASAMKKKSLTVFGKMPFSILKKRSPDQWRQISFPPVPVCGDLNISQIQSSQYFFN
jgi:DNA-directed RNA polymerase, mitochondrial